MPNQSTYITTELPTKYTTIRLPVCSTIYAANHTTDFTAFYHSKFTAFCSTNCASHRPTFFTANFSTFFSTNVPTQFPANQPTLLHIYLCIRQYYFDAHDSNQFNKCYLGS